MTTASAKRAWKTRRSRYGNNGKANTDVELKRTVIARRTGITKMDELRELRRETSGKRAKRAITKQIARVRANSRWRPRKSYFYKGDQIRPLSNTPAGLRQWATAVSLDDPRDGGNYEKWEGRGNRHPPSKGFPRGKDKYHSEWLQLKAKPRKAIKKIV